jgi:quercetin dioxygenase-like cupin family protein
VRHYHQRARQLFYLLQGKLTIELQDRALTLAPGDACEVPPGATHRVGNAGDADATFLVISAPTTEGDRINVTPGNT